MLSYLMIGGSIVLMTATFACQKLWQKNAGTAPARGLLFFVLCGTCSFLFFLALGGFRLHFTATSLLLAGLLTAACVIYTVLGFRLLASGGMGIYTLCIMSGGMILPYLYGLIFLDEPFSVLRLIGLLIILGGVVTANSETEKTKTGRGQYILCVAVFLLNGLVSVFSKMHQVENVLPVVSTVEFVALSNLYKVVFAGVALPFFLGRHPDAAPEKLPRRCIAIAVGAALTDGVGYFLQLRGASEIDASLLYPFLTGGSVVLAMLCGVLCFGEKASKRSVIGTALCFIGTLFFLNL